MDEPDVRLAALVGDDTHRVADAPHAAGTIRSLAPFPEKILRGQCPRFSTHPLLQGAE